MQQLIFASERPVLYQYVTLSIVLVSTTRLSSSFLMRFSFFRKFILKLKYWKHSKSPVIVTKNARNPKYRFFRRTYARSVGFEMKPVWKSVFLCYGKNQLKLFCKSCRNEQPFLSYLFVDSLCSNICTL